MKLREVICETSFRYEFWDRFDPDLVDFKTNALNYCTELSISKF